MVILVDDSGLLFFLQNRIELGLGVIPLVFELLGYIYPLGLLNLKGLVDDSFDESRFISESLKLLQKPLKLMLLPLGVKNRSLAEPLFYYVVGMFVPVDLTLTVEQNQV